MILKCFQSLQLLLVLPWFLHSTYAVFLFCTVLIFQNFSAYFWIIFLSPGIATSINIRVPFSLSLITISGWLLGMVLSICNCWFHSMVTLTPRLVSTDFGTCSYQCFFYLIVPLFPCICWSVAVHSLYHGFLYTVLLPVLGTLIWCGLLSHQYFCYVVRLVLCWHYFTFSFCF
jgi:hypothetical protein